MVTTRGSLVVGNATGAGHSEGGTKDGRRRAGLVATATLGLILLAGATIGHARPTSAAVPTSGTPSTGETPCPLGGTAPCGDYATIFPLIIPGETPCSLGGTAPCGMFGSGGANQPSMPPGSDRTTSADGSR